MTSNFAGSNRVNRIARAFNVVLGTWLFISAFLWEHGAGQRTNTWILGVLIVVIAFVAMSIPAARWLNTVLAVWLFISVWALPQQSAGTMWNNAVVAILVLEFTLVFPAGGEHGPIADRAPA